MNEFTSQLQENLIILNDKVNNAYKQFNDVYAAFESLNKEKYITGIVGAFNQADEATKRQKMLKKKLTRQLSKYN